MSTRIYFATDIHGSDKCWMKFLNAAEYYEADVLILGGDMTGKAVVPIIEQPDGNHKATFQDHKLVLKSNEEVEDLVTKSRNAGYYPYVTNYKEIEELKAEPKKIDELFLNFMLERIKKWMQIADERLKNTKIQCYVCPGNDDEFEIDAIIEKAKEVNLAEGRVFKIDEFHEMISTGWTNPTPWHTYRECGEEEIAERIEAMTSQVQDMPNAIFNIHAPPYRSLLDEAPELDEDLRPKYGGRVTIPVGSVAVRDALKKHQPLLGLFGHIHEGKGESQFGRTLCINPGSSYEQGSLLGAVINLSEDKIKNYYLTVG